ncbi:HNH endonuclease [Methylophilus methylotrophus]|uniref:HNH endonuclease n=1 Tax=Methylophilus methylotrophus TaxID=17 RepID=UPI00233E836A|nr:HNH endonuclease [Methylophilus methylotrophus]
MTKINEAKAFVLEKVIAPVIESNIGVEYKNKARHAKGWIERFEYIGDLLDYLKRFKAENNHSVYRVLKNHGLLTFEDIIDELFIRFEAFSNQRASFDDFIVGRKYSSYQILILGKKYDTRVGGILIVGNNDVVIIKATLKGGDYPNEWLKEHESLKYFLKSIRGNYNIHYKENAAIHNNQAIPIYTFIRETPFDDFTFEGIFNYESLNHEPDGSMWFKLNKQFGADDKQDAIRLQKIEAIELLESLNLTDQQRRARLLKAPKKPSPIMIVSRGFKRNMDVVAEVLLRANGVCESCGNKAPFNKQTDGTPYLEVHHKKRLADGGDDDVNNAIALCPNCHRNEHYGNPKFSVSS